MTFTSELDRSLDAHVVKLGRVESDNSDFTVQHEPGNPAADAKGDVKYPNVNALEIGQEIPQQHYRAVAEIIG